MPLVVVWRDKDEVAAPVGISGGFLTGIRVAYASGHDSPREWLEDNLRKAILLAYEGDTVLLGRDASRSGSGVQAIPTLLVLRRGQVAARQAGAVPWRPCGPVLTAHSPPARLERCRRAPAPSPSARCGGRSCLPLDRMVLAPLRPRIRLSDRQIEDIQLVVCRSLCSVLIPHVHHLLCVATVDTL